MKNLNKTILIALGMALPLSVMASPDDDVTIRMMEVNEHSTQAVTRHIELPEAAENRAKEHAAEGLETANRNRNRNRNGDDGEHEMEREESHEREMEREMERDESHEREMDRDDRKDVEHEGIDREEIEREGLGHGGDTSQP